MIELTAENVPKNVDLTVGKASVAPSVIAK
jgi:hypothetical protein